MTLVEVRTNSGFLRFLVLEPELHRGVVTWNELTADAWIAFERAKWEGGEFRLGGTPHPDAKNRLEGVVGWLHDRGLEPEMHVMAGEPLEPLAEPDIPPFAVS